MNNNRRERRKEAAAAARKTAQETLRRMDEGKHDYGDAPISPEYRAKMIAVMQTIDSFVNEGRKGPTREHAVVILMFPFGSGPGRTNFMSNGVDRKDLVILFKEMIARFEGMPTTDSTTKQ